MAESMTTFDDEITLNFAREERPRVAVRDWGVASSIGHVRTENEDAWGHNDTRRFAVADGMGGTSGGLLAARLSVAAFLEIDPTDGWVPSLVALNEDVARECLAQGFRSAGSTLVALEIERHRCVTVHIGDSRIYRVREGILQLLTTDHNLGNLRREEGLDPNASDARGTPRALTSWIGATVEPDRIDVGTLSVDAGDRVVLATDGTFDLLNGEEIEDILTDRSAAGEAAQQLVDAADAAGGRDNSTALVVDLGVEP